MKDLMKKLLLGLMVSVALVACNNSTNSASGVSVTTDQIKADLVKQVPGLTKVDQVNPTKISGLYEVVVGRKIFYVSTDGKLSLIWQLNKVLLNNGCKIWLKLILANYRLI